MKKFIYIALALIIAVKLGYLRNPFEPKPDLTGFPTDEVILYSTSWCGYCRKARNLMDEHGIQYTEYDIEVSSEAKAQYDQLNGGGVPLMLINGEVVRGYQPRRIKQLAKRS